MKKPSKGVVIPLEGLSILTFNEYYSQTSGVPSTLAVLNEVPQPHDAMAFGLSMVKPPPIKDCL